MTKIRAINYVLWLAFILAMAASIRHLAWTFGTVEHPGWEWFGWVPAIAIDTGLAALAYTIQQRKRAKRSVAILWGGVAGFAAVSALANLYHALAVEEVAVFAGWIVYAKAIVLSATLPVAYIFLGEIISGDDATVAERSERQSEREQARADRIARTSELVAERERDEAARLLLEAGRSETEPMQAVALAVACESCGRTFRSINARNAHKCEVSENGRNHD
jgi:hypothetical protein